MLLARSAGLDCPPPPNALGPHLPPRDKMCEVDCITVVRRSESQMQQYGSSMLAEEEMRPAQKKFLEERAVEDLMGSLAF